ncbi:transcription initiation factor TFIID subunit A-domain-containing protein, partial [Jimgerdemannia flammicorona]
MGEKGASRKKTSHATRDPSFGIYKQRRPFSKNHPSNASSLSTMAPDQANDNKPITFPTAAIADQVNAADLFIQGKLQELVRQNDPNDNMDPEVEEILMELATDFIQSVTGFACRLANHRKSDTLEVKDLKLHL